MQSPGQTSGHRPTRPLAEQPSGDDLGGARPDPTARRSGLVAASVGAVALLVWIGWRAQYVDLHPVELVFFGAELVGLLGAVVISSLCYLLLT